MTNSAFSCVKLKNVSKVFRYGKQKLLALNEISLDILKGETLGVVGESGSGKSTLGRVILKLDEPTTGEVYFQGNLLNHLSTKQLFPLRCQMQMIFQDPYSSLNPRLTIEQIIGEGIDIHKLASGNEKKTILENLMSAVGLDPHMLHRYPHEFSGGQKQRIGIARALAVNPFLIVCDEPLSALDPCTQNQVMQLLLKLKKERELTYVFISHDLHAVKRIADHVAVMYLGSVVELASVHSLFSSPLHPYTQALMDAIPVVDVFKTKVKKRLMITGDPPSMLNPPTGCPFHPRCPLATPICREIKPKLQKKGSGHYVACHVVKQLI